MRKILFFLLNVLTVSADEPLATITSKVYFDIEINDELEENTTFVFNFGESVKDNNEGNLLPYFKWR